MTERDDEVDQPSRGNRGRHQPSEPPDSADEAPSYDEHFPLLTHTSHARPTPTPYPRRPARPRPSETPPPAARPVPSPRKRSGGRTAGRVVVALLSALALIGTGYGYATLDTLQDNVHTTDALNQGDQAPPADDGATDILLVGTDARTDMQGNALPLDVLKELRTEDKPGVSTDTLIVLRIPHNGDKPTGVSIPRDAWSPRRTARTRSVRCSAARSVRRRLIFASKAKTIKPKRRVIPTKKEEKPWSRRCRSLPRCGSTTTRKSTCLASICSPKHWAVSRFA